MPLLSEKARGKQRAIPAEPIALPKPVDAPLPKKELTVRFSEGVEDLVIYVAENETVPDVKAKVRS